MKSLSTIIVIFSLTITLVNSAKFLQIADLHYDIDYDVNGDNADSEMCHKKEGYTPEKPLGEYGDYMCDSSPKLVDNAIKSAAKTIPDPDIILWTGDNIPHIEEYSDEYVTRAFNFTTSVLKQYFPDSIILPALGNHDNNPNGIFEVDDKVYKMSWNLWKNWLKPENEETFLRGGYYSVKFNGAIFLVLNTNLIANSNKVDFGKEKDDPVGQFAYAKKLFEQGRKDKQKVHVVAHIPPGVYERREIQTRWLKDEHNKKFVEMVIEYKDVIGFMIYGHHHTDTYHIIRDHDDNPIQVSYVSPSVTPWYSGWSLGANNPTFRIFEYNKDTWNIEDALTYSVNLAELNKDPNTEWKLEYSFKKAYELEDLSPKSFAELTNRIAHNKTLFDLYLKFNSVGYGEAEPLSDKRVKMQLCSLNYTDYDKHTKCYENEGSYIKPSGFVIVSMIITTLFSYFLN